MGKQLNVLIKNKTELAIISRAILLGTYVSKLSSPHVDFADGQKG